jgi:hypothetical protein
VSIGYHGTGFSDSDSPVDNLVFVSALVGTFVAVDVAVVLVFFFKNRKKK